MLFALASKFHLNGDCWKGAIESLLKRTKIFIVFKLSSKIIQIWSCLLMIKMNRQLQKCCFIFGKSELLQRINLTRLYRGIITLTHHGASYSIHAKVTITQCLANNMNRGRIMSDEHQYSVLELSSEVGERDYFDRK